MHCDIDLYSLRKGATELTPQRTQQTREGKKPNKTHGKCSVSDNGDKHEDTLERNRRNTTHSPLTSTQHLVARGTPAPPPGKLHAIPQEVRQTIQY